MQVAIHSGGTFATANFRVGPKADAKAKTETKSKAKSKAKPKTTPKTKTGEKGKGALVPWPTTS